MNIAASPDPASLSTPDPVPGLFTGLPNSFTEIPFADLLGTPPESSPEETPGAFIPKAPPRKQATDTIDPALVTLLPFLTQQLPQPPPAPSPLPPSAGENPGVTTEGSATNLQTVFTTPALTQYRGIFLPQPQRPDDSASAGLPPNIAAENLPSLAADEQTSILQTDIQKPFATPAGNPISSIESAAFPDDSVRAEAIDRQPVQQLPQLIAEPVQAPLIPRENTSAVQQGSDAAALSVPEMGTTPVMPPGTNPPAEFSPAAVPSATPIPTPMNGIPADNHSSTTEPERSSDEKAAPRTDGTTAAMQLRVMPELFNERTLKAKTNDPATPSAAVQNRTTAVPGIPVRNGTERRLDPEPVTEKRTLIRADAAVEKMAQPPAPAHAPGQAEAPAAADVTAAVRITRQTMDLAEHVRAMGRDHVEVQMRLRDGEEVTVSLRLEKGEWKPVFKTDSEALCRALEQNWNRAVTQPSAQGIRFGTPVFESQPTQTGGGQNGHANEHQQPDARDRSFNRREQEPAFAIPTQPARTALTTATPNRTAVTPGVQLYA